jgi:hypothetical protein
MQRTDDDILTRKPLSITLGAKDYEVKILPLGPSRRWRTQLLNTMSAVLASFKAQPTPDNMAPALTAAMLTFPEKLQELVEAYSPEIKAEHEYCEENASDEQLAAAYGKVMAVAFPYLAQLSLTTTVLKSNAR